MVRALVLSLLAFVLAPAAAGAQGTADLWTDAVKARIRDRSTLNPTLIARTGYSEVFFDSEVGEANWGDSAAPYDLHTGGTIRIHGYLAVPSGTGPFPAIVIGHGHGGSAELDLARVVALFGYVALSISGPEAGQSTGGPEDTEQAWITVEPSADYGFLYHYAYAGMRALTLLEALAAAPGNPHKIDPARLGVMGASMGGQLTYYVNGVDDRVKAAVAIAVAGDWKESLFYPGSWLYHGLYYYTRDGLQSGTNWPNAVADVCSDDTLDAFVRFFDPISYGPTQHGRLLTIIGSHDQYFPLPAINASFDRVQSAGTDPGFSSRVLIMRNGKHGVVDNGSTLTAVLAVVASANKWLEHAFEGGPRPPDTPVVHRLVSADRMHFIVPAAPGDTAISQVYIDWATQVDTTANPPCDFSRLRLLRLGGAYFGSIPIGAAPSCGAAATADNLIYYASVSDWEGYTVSSRVYRGGAPMAFSPAFQPVLEHFPRDSFPVPPAPAACLLP